MLCPCCVVEATAVGRLQTRLVVVEPLFFAQYLVSVAVTITFSIPSKPDKLWVWSIPVIPMVNGYDEERSTTGHTDANEERSRTFGNSCCLEAVVFERLRSWDQHVFFFSASFFPCGMCPLPSGTHTRRPPYVSAVFFFFFVYLLLLRAFLSLPCLLFCFRRYAPPLLLVISSQPDRLPLLPRVVPVCPIICRSLCLRPFRWLFRHGPGRRSGIHPGRLLEPRAQHASGVEASSGGECLFCLALKS